MMFDFDDEVVEKYVNDDCFYLAEKLLERLPDYSMFCLLENGNKIHWFIGKNDGSQFVDILGIHKVSDVINYWEEANKSSKFVFNYEISRIDSYGKEEIRWMSHKNDRDDTEDDQIVDSIVKNYVNKMIFS